MSDLQFEELKIYEGQWLSDTPKFKNGTPSDYIIFKTLTGLGATHGEILIYDRYNSIIVNPGVTVIEGKRDELDENGNKVYPNMFAVYNKVTIQQVVRYLKNDVFPKKIVCTPEAYIKKVKPATEECTEYSLFDDFFMLLDECDKLTTENNYRSKIIAPMDDFFQFKRKAMISATALTPSDERFAEHNFKILKVVPQYKYDRRINLISTNNVTEAIRRYITKYPNEKWFVFLNSTELIYSTIKALDIEYMTKVFCAPESVRKLRRMEFHKAYDKLCEFEQINMFTSRFFSAVDMKVGYKPNILIVTNVYKAQHSIIDPYADSIQIAGRLRNGFSRLAHVTNYNSEITWQDKETALEDIQDSFEQYTKIVKMADANTTKGGRETLIQAINRVDIKKFVNDEHRLMSYMVDNHLLEQEIRKLYRHTSFLRKAYEQTCAFTIKSISIESSVTDAQMLALELAKGRDKVVQSVAEILHSAESEDGNMVFFFNNDLNEIKTKYPDIVEQYDALKYEKFKELGFNQVKIKRSYQAYLNKRQLYHAEMAKEIKSWYVKGDEPIETEVKQALKDIYLEYKIPKPASATHIQLHYHSRKTTNKQGVHIWKIHGVKD
ncbi:MAG: hypothetical protein EOO43_02420 [Flavobacterium sp.]|nr:MAG: hypothetical protein EOO43_02420 [Flavobacterium sp.]